MGFTGEVLFGINTQILNPMKTRIVLCLGAFMLGMCLYAQDTDVPSNIFYDNVRNISELNDPNLGDAFPWISADGLRIYYTQGNFPEKRLVVTTRPDTLSLFGAPIEVPGVSSVGSFSHWLSDDELNIYLCNGTALYVSKRNTIGQSFTIPVQVDITLPLHDFIYGPSLSADRSKLYLCVSFQDEFLGIYELTETAENTYGDARLINFPTGHLVHSGQLSKDGLVFFYSASLLGSKDQIYMLQRTTMEESFNPATGMKVGGISDPDFNNGQCSMSVGLKWVAFVRSSGDNWNSNDLYLAHLSYPSAIGEENKMRDMLSVYPNPAKEWLVVEQNNEKNAKAGIYSVEGNLIGEYALRESNATIDISGLSPGLYFIRIERADRIVVRKFVKSL